MAGMTSQHYQHQSHDERKVTRADFHVNKANEINYCANMNNKILVDTCLNMQKTMDSIFT